MLFQLLYCFPLFLCSHSALYNGDLYFDSNDERRADCIALSAIDTYSYLGDKSVTRGGEQCLPWREVYDITVKNLASKPQELQEYHERVLPEEVMLHNKCRGLLLNPKHPLINLTKGIQGGVASSSQEPWCYYRKKIGKKMEIKLERCFDTCVGQPREEKTEPGKSQYGEKQVQKNYNDILIENIQKYYKSYSWGDVSYYRWKPSDDSFSAEYYRMREQIFYGCTGTVIVLILWLLMCSYLRKEAAAARRRREQAIKMIFPNRKIQLHPVVRPHVS